MCLDIDGQQVYHLRVRYSTKGGIVEYLTVDEVAAKLRVAPKTVRRWCASGQLRALRAGRPWRIKSADLEIFMQAQLEVKEEPKKTDGLAAFATRPMSAAAL